MLYKANPDGLLASMADFLEILGAQNMSAGFVFFDDCWAHSGASLTATCTPKQVTYNASPLALQAESPCATMLCDEQWRWSYDPTTVRRETAAGHQLLRLTVALALAGAPQRVLGCRAAGHRSEQREL